MTKEIINEMIREYEKLEEVVAVTIAGSKAAKRNDDWSDLDIDVFVTKPIALEKRRQIASKFSSRMEIGNDYFGSGDEYYLDAFLIEVDVCYFNWHDMVNHLMTVMERYQATTGYTTCFVYNVMNATIVYDKTGAFHDTVSRYQNQYPDELKKSIIKKNYPILRTCFSSYYHQIEKAIKRQDLNSINHRITAFLASYFDIIFAINQMLHPGEKRLVSIIEKECQKCPPNLRENMAQLMSAIGVNDEAILIYLNEMVDELDVILNEESLI